MYIFKVSFTYYYILKHKVRFSNKTSRGTCELGSHLSKATENKSENNHCKLYHFEFEGKLHIRQSTCHPGSLCLMWEIATGVVRKW